MQGNIYLNTQDVNPPVMFEIATFGMSYPHSYTQMMQNKPVCLFYRARCM